MVSKEGVGAFQWWASEESGVQGGSQTESTFGAKSVLYQVSGSRSCEPKPTNNQKILYPQSLPAPFRPLFKIANEDSDINLIRPSGARPPPSILQFVWTSDLQVPKTLFRSLGDSNPNSPFLTIGTSFKAHPCQTRGLSGIH